MAKYGFFPKVGMHIYTSSEKNCCPDRGVVSFVNNRLVKYIVDGVEKEKKLSDFMKSSWVDKVAEFNR